ncbi:MAG: hypothetical protein OXH94_06265 [Rhodospirillales bacterium]|nr:hypothetical protein [Rhodospirillales bacterium]
MLEQVSAFENFVSNYPLVIILAATMIIFGLRLLGVGKRAITWIGAALLVAVAALIVNSIPD